MHPKESESQQQQKTPQKTLGSKNVAGGMGREWIKLSKGFIFIILERFFFARVLFSCIFFLPRFATLYLKFENEEVF